MVIPVFNEEEGVSSLCERLIPVLGSLTASSEIIFVNDGSQDGTAKRVKELMNEQINIRLITLSKNSGHMQALAAGLMVSKGRYVVTMDGDLQHPPETIEIMYERISSKESPDVVQAVRTDRSTDSFFKKFTATIFYKLARKVTGVAVIPHAADFRVMTRETVNAINSLPEKNKILRFLIPELGFTVETVSFNCEDRAFGKSKYSFGRMFSFAFDSIISFSAKPLRLMSLIGFSLSGLFSIGTLVTFIVWYTAKTVPGWTSIFMLMLTANSIILASLGLLGEYVAKIRETTLGRPNVRWKEEELS